MWGQPPPAVRSGAARLFREFIRATSQLNTGTMIGPGFLRSEDIDRAGLNPKQIN